MKYVTCLNFGSKRVIGDGKYMFHNTDGPALWFPCSRCTYCTFASNNHVESYNDFSIKILH